MSRRKLVSVLATLTLAAACLFAAHPAYASVADGHIVTSDDLMALVTSTSADATRGHTYTLDADVSIDTSDLATSFSRYSPARVFAGTLDGAGHTITVTAADGKASKPLFDLVEGKAGASSGRAQIKNLTLAFEGDAQGATLAGGVTDVLIQDVAVNYQNVLPAKVSSTAVSTGLVGFFFAGDNSFDEGRPFTKLSNVTVTGGDIGSSEARDESSVYSGGFGSFVGVGNVLIENSELGMGSVSAVASSGSASACGAVTGDPWGQCQLALNGVTVHASSITAKSSGGGDVYALGLATSPIGMKGCHVEVDGDISVEGNSSQGDVIASGLCFRPYCTSNAELGFGAVSDVSVEVDGSICANSHGGASAGAYGLAYLLEVDAGWSNVTVRTGHISSAATSGEAYAAGVGLLETLHLTDNLSQAKLDSVAVEADSIEAVSTQGNAYSQGFLDLASYPSIGCTVTVGEIVAQAAQEAESVGFVNSFMADPYMRISASDPVADGCKVVANKICAMGSSANNASLGVAGFGYNLAADGPYAVQNCSVTIADELSAKVDGELVPEAAGLFATDNSNGTKLFNNTVTLPRDQANVVTLDGDDAGNYVRFTASEASGRADTADWESDNQVLFSDARGGGSVTCAFDDGSDHDTLWRLPDLQYGDLTVSCDATGSGASDADEFEFTITLDDATVSGTYGDLEFVDGVATIKLRAGQSASALQLPEGVGYKVSAVAPDGYVVTSSEGVEGTIEKDSTASAKFSFKKDKAADPVTPVMPTTPSTPETPGGGSASGGDAGNGAGTATGNTAGSKPSSDVQLPQTGDSGAFAPFLTVAGFVTAAAGVLARRFGSK